MYREMKSFFTQQANHTQFEGKKIKTIIINEMQMKKEEREEKTRNR